MTSTPPENPGLTEPQVRPLAVRGASVALSSGAGCGKTTVLSARFLDELEGPDALPLGSIVALTFTEKAAREIRKRIRRRCREKLARGEDPARWRVVLPRLEAAPIGTFHEFCGRWLRHHAVQAGIDPDFMILDESAAAAIRDEALAKCLRRRLAALDPDLIDLAAECGLGRVRQALAVLLAERSASRLADWASRTPEEVVALWKGAWDREGRDRLFRKVVRAARPCLELLTLDEGSHPEMRKRRAFLLENLPALEAHRDDDTWLVAVREQAKVKGAGTRAHWPSPEAYESLVARFAGLRKAIEECLAKARWDDETTREAAAQGLRLARLAQRARRAYDGAKRRRGGLDFDDLLIRTRDLMRERPGLARQAPGGGTIERLLVDEFQDTDPIQGEILDRIAGEEGASGRLFLVGDPRQSIYRFRGAQPRIFQEFRDRFPDEGRHALADNFRSVPPILDFVNALFAEAFPEPGPALVARRDAEDQPDQPAVEFLWAAGTEEAALPGPGASEGATGGFPTSTPQHVVKSTGGQATIATHSPQVFGCHSPGVAPIAESGRVAYATDSPNSPPPAPSSERGGEIGPGELPSSPPLFQGGVGGGSVRTPPRTCNPAETRNKDAAHDRRVLEARTLARRLRQRLDAGWKVRDRQAKALRDAHPGDIAFLFRAMTDVSPYEEALDEVGIAYHTTGGAAFYRQQEVHDLVNLLSAIEDPLDPVALAGSLRSPFFCVSDDGLFWLATARGDLAAGLEDSDRIAELSPLDRDHAGRARALLGRWREAKDRLPIASMIDRILDESGYEASLVAEPLGGRKRANVRKLVRLARGSDLQGAPTLAAFVARLRNDLRRPPREEQAATADEEGTGVRLMSIHQAKGLEFSIVVLPDLNRRTPSQTESVAFHPLLGPLVRPSQDPGQDAPETASKPRRQSLGWLTYQALEQAEDEDEALRLFYVATTRACDTLILSAGLAPSERPSSPALQLVDERFDRQTGQCRAPLPDGWRRPAIHVTRESSTSAASSRAEETSPSLLGPAETIEQTAVEGCPAAPSTYRRPRLVDLEPSGRPASGVAHLDRLARSVLADPGIWEAEDWTKFASRAARRLDPLASARRIDALIERLRPAVDGPLGRAVAVGDTVERAVDWTLSWPRDEPDATVFRGRIDFVFGDREGQRRVVLIGSSAASMPRERLRLLLSARAAGELGLGPIRQGWLILLGVEGSLLVEDRFDDLVVQPAFHEFINKTII